MRVSAIGSSYLPKTNNKLKNNIAFKADIRVDYGELRELPDEYAGVIRPYLERAEKSEEYKKMGSDNMLLKLKLCQSSQRNPKKRLYGITIESEFKDIERARKELIENNDRDYPSDGDKDVIGLKKRDPEIMRRLRLTDKTITSFMPLKYWPVEEQRMLDDNLKAIIHNMSYIVPKEPKTYEDSGILSDADDYMPLYNSTP